MRGVKLLRCAIERKLNLVKFLILLNRRNIYIYIYTIPSREKRRLALIYKRKKRKVGNEKRGTGWCVGCQVNCRVRFCRKERARGVEM